MRIEQDTKLDYKDVLIRPKRSEVCSRKDVDLERGFYFKNYTPTTLSIENIKDRQAFRGVPIMAANMDGVATFEMADVLASYNMFTCLKKDYTVDQLIGYFNADDWKRTEFTAITIGIRNSDLFKFRDVYEIVGDAVKYVCIDVANGYSVRFSEFVKMFRGMYPHVVIIAGNVVTGEMTEELLLNGADIIKVGIGPGSVCTTRIQTGVGYPQLSAVMECADAAHGLGGHIIADGGCTCAGDVAKAFAGGADFVMLGGMLAGHDEGGGEVITKYYNPKGEFFFQKSDETYHPVIERKKFVQFYGMSSQTANEKHNGGLQKYRSSEGREVLIPYRGAVEDTILDILGGLRSTCTYAGAARLKHLSRCTTFVRCTQQFNGVFV